MQVERLVILGLRGGCVLGNVGVHRNGGLRKVGCSTSLSGEVNVKLQTVCIKFHCLVRKKGNRP